MTETIALMTIKLNVISIGTTGRYSVECFHRRHMSYHVQLIVQLITLPIAYQT